MEKLSSLYKEPNIVEEIKFRRLGSAGHIIKMEEHRIPKKVLKGNFHTARPVGRPRTRWVDVLQRDAQQLLGIRGWRSKTANRDEWSILSGRPRPGRGCSAMDEWMGIFCINLCTVVIPKVK
jgi:hypothetical protein